MNARRTALTSIAQSGLALGEAGPIVEPLIHRHAGDAAFYWSQRDASAHSALVDFAQLTDFDRLLGAHLDGLVVAGQTGWRFAEQALQRHGGAGETFVCTWLALTGADATRLAAVNNQVTSHPQRMLRGLISALAWADPARAWPWIEHWLDTRAEPHLRVAALRAAALLPDQAQVIDGSRLAMAADDALVSALPAIRSAACRLAAKLDPSAPIEHLCEDPDGMVRAEAAIALVRHDATAAASVLWPAVVELTGRMHVLSGWPRYQAERRVSRWVRHLGLAMQPGHPGVATVLQTLPSRLALCFLLAHGDAAWLPWIVERMDHPDCARFAGWVWQTISGVDLQNNDLAEPPRRLADDESLRPTDDLDAGLPQPDADRVRALTVPMQIGVRTILGHHWNEVIAFNLTHDAPQALRWLAARWFELESGAQFDNRAPSRRQLSQLAALTPGATKVGRA